MINAAHALPYSGLTLDRAGARRADDAWLAAARHAPVRAPSPSGATGAPSATASR
ncbi:hypothetical protein ACFQV2_22355 [Actinokineospora soli]|uniref:Uncharacterized protein n=1 Tax=Actinokineospora soli TaxID=1048753 RepID=A0ABW2TPV2_9PSEU